jgi:hypothetical protein
MSDAPRANRRFKASLPLQIRCDSWDEFASLYSGDISLGGLFILTPDPPPLMSTVEVNVGLPEGHEMTLTAKVVHVLSSEEAEAEGKEPGVGVEFQDLDPAMKNQLWHLVEFARWEGTQDLSRSYATALMEFNETREIAPYTGERESPSPARPEMGEERTSLPQESLSEAPAPEEEDGQFGELDSIAPGEPAEPGEPEPDPEIGEEPITHPHDDRESTSEPIDERAEESEPEPERESGPEPEGGRESEPEPEDDKESEPEPVEERESTPAKATPRKSRPGTRASVPHPAARPALKGLATALGHSIRPSRRPDRKGRKPDVKRAGAAAQKLAASLESVAKVAPPPGRPSKAPQTSQNPERMKEALKHIAYKRYELAVKVLKALVEAEPENREAKIWYHTADGRRLAKDGKRKAAAKAFQSVLEVDEGNKEALKFVRAYHKEEKVKNVPFARYFMKKT